MHGCIDSADASAHAIWLGVDPAAAPRLHTVISIRGESCHQHDSIKNRRRNDWGHPWWWLRYSYDALLYSLNFFFSFSFFQICGGKKERNYFLSSGGIPWQWSPDEIEIEIHNQAINFLFSSWKSLPSYIHRKTSFRLMSKSTFGWFIHRVYLYIFIHLFRFFDLQKNSRSPSWHLWSVNSRRSDLFPWAFIYSNPNQSKK